MKKVFALAIIFTGFIFVGETKAQLPYNGYSNPSLVSSNHSSLVIGETTYYRCTFNHYGNPFNGSTSYYLYVETSVYKLNGLSQWVLVEGDSYDMPFLNRSYSSPNVTASEMGDTDIKDNHGTGFYKFSVNVYAYNIVNGSKAYMWNQFVSFQVH